MRARRHTRRGLIDDELVALRHDVAQATLTIERLQRVLHDAPIGIVSFGRDGHVDFVNQRVLDASGAADAIEFDGMFAAITHPDDQPQIDAAVATALGGQLAEYGVRIRGADGRWLDVQGSMLPTFVDGRLNGMVSIFRDVTRQIESELALVQFRAIAEVTTDIVGITALDGRIIYLNPAGRKFLDFDDQAPRHLRDFFEFIPAEYHRELMRVAYPAVLAGEVWEGDLELVDGRDLARCPMSAVIVGITDDDGQVSGIAVTYRDLSERKRLERELEHAAAHDQLTGLVNRQEVFSSLEANLASGAPTAVLFFDLDDFKMVNDSLGHDAGDEALRIVAERLREGARGTDVIGRLGGDEFLVICRGVSREHDALAIADEIMSVVHRPMVLSGRPHQLTGSVGVALSHGRATGAAALIQDADIAMYCAKRAGRRRAMLFDAEMRSEAVERLEMDRDLRQAIERDEFVLHFQPLLYFGRDVVQNFEALIRWNHPRLGLLPPSEFLPFVEQFGLTGDVGRWVFDAATRAVAAMRLVEPQACVGVNVHPDQIRQPGFVESLTRCMLSARITGEAIAIEITEHAVMVDVERTRAVLDELRAIGVSVAIDDFGTGYSNLDLLRRLPVDYLKIDRSFVVGLGIEPGDSQLVRMILALSQELGIEVIAEGVETELQASELQRLGCRIGQGYLFARPLPFDDAIALLRRQNERLGGERLVLDPNDDQQASPPSSDMIVPVMNRAVSEAM